MSASSDWVAGLRQALKQQFPLGGFSVREMKGKVFLQKRWPDGTRQAAALPIAWGPGVTLEVLATVKAVNEHFRPAPTSVRFTCSGPKTTPPPQGESWHQLDRSC